MSEADVAKSERERQRIVQILDDVADIIDGVGCECDCECDSADEKYHDRQCMAERCLACRVAAVIS